MIFFQNCLQNICKFLEHFSLVLLIIIQNRWITFFDIM